MSVFKVVLTAGNQGLLDSNALSHSNVSIQRTMYVMGPNKVNRKLIDGATFTDSNYWKQYASPAVPVEQAIVTVVTDDGSVYSSVPQENSTPVVYNITVSNGTTYTTANGAITTALQTQTYTGNSANLLNDWGNASYYTQITTTTNNLNCRVNGQSIIALTTTAVQSFEETLPVTLLEFANTSGGSATVQILGSVRTAGKS